MPEPGEETTSSKPSEKPEVRVWIAKMFAALGLGEPSYLGKTGPAPKGEPPGGDPPGGDPGDAEDGLAARRVAVLLRLDAIALAPEVSAGERAEIEGHVASIRANIAAVGSAEELDKVEAALARVESLAAAANAAAAARALRCQAVAKAMAAITRPTGGVEGDYTAYDAELPAIGAIGTPPVAEAALAAAEAAVVRLKAEAERLASVLADRAKRAAALRSAIPAKLPTGANPGEAAAVSEAETRVIAALGVEGSPLSATALAEAETQAKDRDTALEAASKAVEARARARETVAATLAKLDLGGIGEAEGLSALAAEAKAVAEALPLALTEAEIEALAQRAGKLAPAAEAARAARAKTILTGLALHKLPSDLPDAEGAMLVQKMDAIRAGATAPLTGAALDAAAKDLAALPGLLTAAAKAVADRAARVKAARAAAYLVTDPDRANASEKAALDKLRKDPALGPVPPLTEAMALAAEAALKTLQDTAAAQALAIKAREAARKATLDRLLTLVPPPNAPGAEALAVLKAGGALRKAVEAAATLAEIEAQDAPVKALAKEVQDLAAFTAARDKVAAKLAVAQAEVGKAAFRINQGCYQALLGIAKTAGGLLDKAKTVGDCAKAEVEIARIAPLIAAAETYQPTMEQWRFDTELYVTGLPEANETEKALKAAMAAQRESLLAAADLLAAAGDIAKATAKLGEFKTAKVTYVDPVDKKAKQASFDNARNTTATAFSKAVETFVKDCVPTLRIVESLELTTPKGKFQTAFMAVKKKGFEDGDYAGATGDLATLTTEVKACAGIAGRLDALAPLAADPAVKPGYDGAVTDAKAGKFGDAKKKLDAIPAAKTDEAAFAARTGGLSKRVAGIAAQLTGTCKAQIETPWKEAPTQASHALRTGKLDLVEAALKEAVPALRARDAAQALCNRIDAKDAYGIMAAARGKEATETLDKAKDAYEAAAGDFRRLEAYLSGVAALELVRKGLTAAQAETDAAIVDALAKAEVEAKARKWDAAEGELAAARAVPLVQSMSAAMALFLGRRRKLEPIQTRLVAQIKEPNPKAALVDPWNAAIEAAEKKNDPVTAADLLAAHEPRLKAARSFAGAASQARLGLAAMAKIEARAIPAAKDRARAAVEAEVAKAKAAAEKAEEAVDKAKTKSQSEKDKAAKAKLAADKTYNDLNSKRAARIAADEKAAADGVTGAIYPPPNGKAELAKKLTLAEAEAGKGDFAKAEALFKAVCTAAQAGMAAAAGWIEDLEDAHYVSAHGPTVTDADSTKRLLTGLRPDGKMEPSNTSSSFGSVEAMLATREAALDKMAVDYPATKETKLKYGDTLEYIVETDSEVPVGKSFKGNKMKKKYQAGEFKESKLCENFRELGPLTRVFTKVIFHFKNPNPAASKPLTNWAAVEAAYKKIDPTLPSDFPGQWVVHQHYPTATGFDPETGEYLD